MSTESLARFCMSSTATFPWSINVAIALRGLAKGRNSVWNSGVVRAEFDEI